MAPMMQPPLDDALRNAFKKHLKYYPHFDAPISVRAALFLVTDPEAVARNPFFPLLRYEQRWQPFRSASCGRPPPKIRPISFASRRDAYIYWYYRRLLAEEFEKKLVDRGLESSVIAYRSVVDPDTGKGLTNIQFAANAFRFIRTTGSCTAIALDIKSYFDTLDHARVRETWCRLLGRESLPSDHYAVFKQLTSYRIIQIQKIYRRLGIIGPVPNSDPPREGYLVSRADMKTQLCSPARLREIIANEPSIVEKNWNRYGIPQGTPISDLIANAYLLDFDEWASAYARTRRGYYVRYSDDILIVLPETSLDVSKLEREFSEELAKYGDQIKLKTKKTVVVEFMSGTNITRRRSKAGWVSNEDGLEYLGFRFDGRHVWLRNSTISRLQRKLVSSVRSTVRNYIGKACEDGWPRAKAMANYNTSAAISRHMKKPIADFDFKDPTTWTFETYLRRAILESADFEGDMRQQVESLPAIASRAKRSAFDKYW